MTKFKKGDKVRRINNNTDCTKIGSIYTIKDNYKGIESVELIESKGYYHEINFELVSSSEEVDKLPEKWCVKGINESSAGFKDSDLYKQINKTFHAIDLGFLEFCYYYIRSGNILHWDYSLPKDYTEITFEQFKQFILNKNEKSTTNEVQRTIATDSRETGGEPVRSKLQTSRITTGAGFSINKISSKPSTSRIKESRTTGSFFKSVYS